MASQSAEYAQAALSAGILCIPYASREKGPRGGGAEGWTSWRFRSPSEIASVFPEGCNVGFLLGEPSGHLADVDLDSPEALALADSFLPPTPMVWGKWSTPRAHRAYRAELAAVAFKDPSAGPDCKATLVELRSDGGQTMAPPSVHPNGEPVLYAPGAWIEPAAADPEQLRRAVADLAAAALLARRYPPEGQHNDAWLAIAGLWLGAGRSVEDGERFARAVASAAGDWKGDKRAAVFGATQAKRAAGEAVTGCSRLGEIVGDPVAKALRKWLFELSGNEIKIGTDIRRMADQAEHVLAKTGLVYAHNRRLVRIGRDRSALRFLADAQGKAPVTLTVSEYPQPTMLELLSTAVQWLKSGKDGWISAQPPRVVVEALLARGEWEVLPALGALSGVPLMMPSGEIQAADGYDPGSGIYQDLSGLEGLAIPPAPGQAEAIQAAAWLHDELLVDFPFHTMANFSAVLAAMLTPFARYAFAGPVPLTLIDSNVRGIGKGLLADVCAIVATGLPAPRMANTHDEEEERKRLMSLALAGATSVLIDNVAGTLGTAALDMAITSQSVRDRVLGRSEIATVAFACQFFATGNNVALKGDAFRRCLHVRMETDCERPEERTDFRHPDLPGWTLGHRKEAVAACLTILRAHALAGRPQSVAPPWGSFTNWQRIVCAAVAWLGLPPPEASRLALQEADGDAIGLASIMEHVEAAGQISVAELIEAADQKAGTFASGHTHEELRAAIMEACPGRNGGLPDARRLGHYLNQYRGRVINGRRLVRVPVGNTKKWKVELVQ